MNRKQRRKVRELKKAVKDDDLEFVTGQIGDPGMHDADAVAMLAGEAAGAIPNGTRIVKAKSEPGDTTPDGAGGKVLSSVYNAEIGPYIFYFLEWDHTPGVPVGCLGWKIARAS
jgi:hypothetical protein